MMLPRRFREIFGQILNGYLKGADPRRGLAGTAILACHAARALIGDKNKQGRREKFQTSRPSLTVADATFLPAGWRRVEVRISISGNETTDRFTQVSSP